VPVDQIKQKKIQTSAFSILEHEEEKKINEDFKSFLD
jgi:hypothetical protein